MIHDKGVCMGGGQLSIENLGESACKLLFLGSTWADCPSFAQVFARPSLPKSFDGNKGLSATVPGFLRGGEEIWAKCVYVYEKTTT
jgi:hypothetical protein